MWNTLRHPTLALALASLLGGISACEREAPGAASAAPVPAEASPAAGSTVAIPEETPPEETSPLDVETMRRGAVDAGLLVREEEPAPGVETRAPAAPRGLTVTALTPSRIALGWTAARRGEAVSAYRILRDGASAGLVSDASFTDEGLRPSSRHCYAVVALDAAGGRSLPSRTLCVDTPDWTPPSVPAGLRAEPRGERHVTVTWGASSDDGGVRGYEVLRGDAVVGRVSGGDFTELGLAPARTYCYSVRAVDGAGNVSPAAGPACATTRDLTPPDPPDTIAAEATGEHAVRVSWGPSADDGGVAGYELLRDGRVVASTGEQLSAVESSLRVTHRYCYTVRAFDAAGNRSAEGGPACATTPDLTAPTAPGDLEVVATSDRRVEARWSASSDEIGVRRYEVLQDGAPVALAEATALVRSGLEPAREYCFVVRAHDAAGNVSLPSRRACATTPDLTPPTAPPRLAAGPNSPFNVVLAWDAATDDVGVASYEILRGGVAVARVDGRSTHYLDAGLAPSTDACYAVVALDAAGNRSPPRPAPCTKTAEPGVPAGPTLLRAAPETVTSVALSWAPSPEPDVVYAVYWDKGRGGRVGSTGHTSFSATVKTGERRCFRVAAVNAAGRESPQTFEACSTPALREALSRADAP